MRKDVKHVVERVYQEKQLVFDIRVIRIVASSRTSLRRNSERDQQSHVDEASIVRMLTSFEEPGVDLKYWNDTEAPCPAAEGTALQSIQEVIEWLRAHVPAAVPLWLEHMREEWASAKPPPNTVSAAQVLDQELRKVSLAHQALSRCI